MSFGIMKKGGGKSLTYQLPVILGGQSTSQNLSVVVSPLLSLIQDQEEQMNQFCSNSAISFTYAKQTLSFKDKVPQQQQKQWSQVRNPDGGVCMIRITPEQIHKFTNQSYSSNN